MKGDSRGIDYSSCLFEEAATCLASTESQAQFPTNEFEELFPIFFQTIHCARGSLTLCHC